LKANATHTHAISDVTNLQSTLNSINTTILAKADASHLHTTADLTDYTPYDDTAVLGYIATNAANIALKADATHNHDNTYAALNHTHTTINNNLKINGN
jgi:hypothetical protein